MGKGIALEFKKRFPDVYKEYLRRNKAKGVKLGEPYLCLRVVPPWDPPPPTLVGRGGVPSERTGGVPPSTLDPARLLLVSCSDSLSAFNALGVELSAAIKRHLFL